MSRQTRTVGVAHRIYSLSEAREMIEDGRGVPMTKRQTKTEKPEDSLLRCPITVKEKRKHEQRMGEVSAKLGLYIITSHLQRFVQNRSLQEVLKENDLVVSWDDEKKKVAVVTKPKAKKRSKA